jgi:mono/diheme cytochrome c family protein
MRKTTVAWVVILAAAGAWLYWFLAAHGFSARDRPSRLEALLAKHARRIATPAGARDLKNPVKPTPLAIAEARDHFADHCAVCHANDGSGQTQIN